MRACVWRVGGLQVRELRKRSSCLPDDYLVVFAGEWKQAAAGAERAMGAPASGPTTAAAAAAALPAAEAWPAWALIAASAKQTPLLAGGCALMNRPALHGCRSCSCHSCRSKDIAWRGVPVVGAHTHAWHAVCLAPLLTSHAAVTGDMITEEALPTYMAMLNTLDGVRDETGAAPTPWAQWTRLWTAEENRHGDLMSKYIYLTGRCVRSSRGSSSEPGSQPAGVQVSVLVAL